MAMEGANGIWIRRAETGDVERLLEIYAWYVRHTAVSFEYEAPDVGEFMERMARTTVKYPYLVVGIGERALGYAYAHPFGGRAAYDWSCELTIYLDPRARGRGLGSRLYAALEVGLGRMGMRNLYACVACPEVEDEYLTFASARFHERMGFAEVGRFHRCGRKFDRWYDMIWMEKVIGDYAGDIRPVTPYPDICRKDGEGQVSHI